MRPLRILIVTMPPWPGEDEAYRVAGRWPVPSRDEPKSPT